MPVDDDLDTTVRRMLASETFEPEELPRVLAKQGHDEEAVAAAVDRVRHEMAAGRDSPTHRRAATAARRAAHLVRLGVFTWIVGLVFTLLMGWGWLQLALVIAVGGALLAAGYRGLRRARAPRR